MKLKLCRNVHNISLYKTFYFYCCCSCVFVAIATYSFYRLTTGKVKVGLYFYLTAAILGKVEIGLYCYLTADILGKVEIGLYS